MKTLLSLFLLFALFSCKSEKHNTLFELKDNDEIGISFINQVNNTEDQNIFNYRNFYNGGGVAIGDINNDGLADIYFTANQGSNKLYINQGDFHFQDITENSGTSLDKQWSTGVIMVDINADGLLDIYVCNAGYQKTVGQENALFINNGDLTFTEKASEYGLADSGYTTHAAFFDYDLDGDLDVYILNNSFIPVNTLNNANNRDLRAENWPVKDFLKGGGDKLLRNDSQYNGENELIPSFVDVSEEAGIFGSLIGFGLGVTVGDVNNDHYPDIYVSNDFYEKDYLYINQKDGSFKEDIENRIGHTSFASMGADMADINNDGYPEIFVTDMLPKEEQRLKTTTAFDSHYAYSLRLQRGFYHQYMQNTLQLNNGKGEFSEIANYSGLEASDWSWGALIFDADNDRNSDIYICNGIQHDVIDQDFIDFFADEVSQNMANSGKKESIKNILAHMPKKPINNLFFKNEGGLAFKEEKNWTPDIPSFSNGASYADLDNDGDLDLVVNNVNQAAFIFQNNSSTQNHYITYKIKGFGQNTFAIGAVVNLYNNDEVLTKQLMPSRGFQSSTAYPLTFGLGDWTEIDSTEIIWPNNTISKFYQVKSDSLYTVDYSLVEKNKNIPKTASIKNTFTPIQFDIEAHLENQYEDYYFEKNIPFKLSAEGPSMAIGDLNGDKLEDIVICGSKNQASQIYLQNEKGFQKSKQNDLEIFAPFEDISVAIFDANGDGHPDIYFGTGGNEAETGSIELKDRLYINDGKANFKYDLKAIPGNTYNTSTVLPIDYDLDGDLDLFVGSRSFPKQYGTIPPSFIYQNEGNGKFTDVSKSLNPDFQTLGMVTSATWSDIDGDKSKELTIVGDWMEPITYRFKAGKFDRIENGLENLYGFWGAITSSDLDNDGDIDLVLGNIGQNFSLKVNQEKPIKMFVYDFDGNGTTDKVMTKTINGRDVPVFLKREMMDQFPALKSNNLKHADYADKSLADLFGNKALENSKTLEVNYLKSIIALNNGDGTFTVRELPTEVQLACIKAITIKDVNGDSFGDIILAGNSRNMIPQFNTLDASRGSLLINDGKNNFVPSTSSGLNLPGEVKDLNFVTLRNKNILVAARNNKQPLFYLLNE
ncbi:VCBS repeat-containing protein [Arcticibacterium luteifluviistationis]|uniref:RNA-binding protein n=1 Tax=Arcticibacterium luteifluviistationis TaxID=1784714 RepID=A0A2Z4GFX2_9BACT|nr:VCBS repeat-containing protein [Arcticibacterium luteifluviistationis]AWV99945.1 RNA-binding protein [Arcticibacterium luteifluviistationis]